ETLNLVFSISVLDSEVLPLNPSELHHPLSEHVQKVTATNSRALFQIANPSGLRRLLRIGGLAKRKEHGAKGKDSDFLLYVFPALFSHHSSLALFSLNHLVRSC